MKYRKLRIAWSVAWGVVAVLLCVLWVRSHWREDVLAHFGKDFVFKKVGVRTGVLYGGYLVEAQSPTNPDWRETHGIEHESFAITYSDTPSWWLDWSKTSKGFAAPLWFVVSLSVIFGSFPWTPWLRLRFSLRTLLIAMTLIAVVLGLIVWRR